MAEQDGGAAVGGTCPRDVTRARSYAQYLRVMAVRRSRFGPSMRSPHSASMNPGEQGLSPWFYRSSEEEEYGLRLVDFLYAPPPTCECVPTWTRAL